MFAGVNDELGRQAYELVIAAPKRGPFKTSSGIGLVADLAIADVSPAKSRASDTLIAAGGDPGLCRACCANLSERDTNRGYCVVPTAFLNLYPQGLTDLRESR